MAIKKILHLCDKHGLVKPVWDGSDVASLRFGPIGELLVNNVKQEWLLSNVINRDENVYPIHSQTSQLDEIKNDIEQTYIYVKSLCNGLLPFGIAQTFSGGSSGHKNPCTVVQPHAAFSPFQRTTLRSLLFVSPNEGRQSFYSWQQKRKMWWRKFSSHPGRFSFSDIKEVSTSDVKVSENGDLRVDILAAFDWGQTVIETINLFPVNSLGIFGDQIEAFKVKDGRKQVLPSVVECTLSLEVASLTFLCDAYSDNSQRQLLRLHRRLAPVKAGFVVRLTDLSVENRLLDVARHLSRTLRQSGLSTLFLPDVSKKSHDSQLARNDKIGIPFTIVLSDPTLNDGIIHLYSRETRLMEQVHISKVPDYMKLLVKNL